MPISYAGVPVCLETGNHSEYLSSVFDLHAAPLADMAGYTGEVNENLPVPAMPKVEYKLETLIWPTGASRPATFACYVNGTQLQQIRDALDLTSTGFGDLILSDCRSGATITASMRMAGPPVPVHAIEGRVVAEKLYLLRLADIRWSWQWRSGSITAQPATWSSLLSSLASSLGTSITPDTIDSDYYTPSARWTHWGQPIPAMLDAAAKAIGHRVIVGLDGTLTTTTWQTATESLDTQFTAATKRAGGQMAVEDVQRTVPANVRVQFGKSCCGLEFEDPFTVDRTLTALSITEYESATGISADTAVLDADYVYTESAFSLATATAFANQLATDWYGWHLAGTDFTAAGIYNWEPTGGEDRIEWEHHASNKINTRIVSPPRLSLCLGGYLPSISTKDPLCRIISISNSGGEYTWRYRVRQVEITDAFNLEDVVTDEGFCEVTDVVELENRLLSTSSTAEPVQGVFPLRMAPDGTKYINGDEGTLYPSGAAPVGSGSGSGLSSSGSGNPCEDCFPTTGDGNDDLLTIDVICSDGVLYVVRARAAIVYENGRIRIQHGDYVWDVEGCCDCGGTSGSSSGSGSGTGAEPEAGTISTACCASLLPETLKLTVDSVEYDMIWNGSSAWLTGFEVGDCNLLVQIGCTGSDWFLEVSCDSASEPGNGIVVSEDTISEYTCEPLSISFDVALVGTGSCVSCSYPSSLVGTITT